MPTSGVFLASLPLSSASYPSLGLGLLKSALTKPVLCPLFFHYRDSGLVVCPACSVAWGCKSPVQPDGGEGRVKHKGVIARWRLKEVRSKTAT